MIETLNNEEYARQYLVSTSDLGLHLFSLLNKGLYLLLRKQDNGLLNQKIGEQVFEKKVRDNIAKNFSGFLGWGTYFSRKVWPHYRIKLINDSLRKGETPMELTFF